MTGLSGLYTCGTWIVKPGREQTFIQAWQDFADWTSRTQAGAGIGTLLQSADDPASFLSFGPWEDAEAIADWRSQPKFKEFIARARLLCVEFHPQTMRLAGYSDTA
jgi:heme-degrading monooxygenase HmoA